MTTTNQTPSNITNHTWLRPGDVFQAGQRNYMVKMVNGSSIGCLPMDNYTVQLEPDVRIKLFEVVPPDATESASGYLMQRMGVAGLLQFLAGKQTSRPGETMGQTTNEGDSMAKDKLARGGLVANAIRAKTGKRGKSVKVKAAKIKVKKLKAARKPKEAKAGDWRGKTERKDTIFDHSVCSVLRALGAAGVKPEQARAILAAKKIPMPDNSVNVQVYYGASGKRPAAPLTVEQIEELKALATQPA